MQQTVESAAFLKDKKALFRIWLTMWKELKADIGFKKSGRQ